MKNNKTGKYNDATEVRIFIQKNLKNHNNWMIEKNQIKVCPYCNLAYTYNRESSKVGKKSFI